MYGHSHLTTTNNKQGSFELLFYGLCSPFNCTGDFASSLRPTCGLFSPRDLTENQQQFLFQPIPCIQVPGMHLRRATCTEASWHHSPFFATYSHSKRALQSTYALCSSEIDGNSDSGLPCDPMSDVPGKCKVTKCPGTTGRRATLQLKWCYKSEHPLITSSHGGNGRAWAHTMPKHWAAFSAGESLPKMYGSKYEKYLAQELRGCVRHKKTRPPHGFCLCKHQNSLQKEVISYIFVPFHLTDMLT